ncbi:unnamed protein product [Brachionus calyciflorus]|uniref:Amine oxidase n=1 Tax=Brachionus calyciflorus TaxID=104777 RepID=A0A813M3G7_9BILA|nr:unnamed protein product [Brachionus calyciflorus]
MENIISVENLNDEQINQEEFPERITSETKNLEVTENKIETDDTDKDSKNSNENIKTEISTSNDHTTFNTTENILPEYEKNNSIEKDQNSKYDYDIIVIGAGLSGLYSAYYLLKKCKGLKILVIEGKDRVGGRTQTVELNSTEDGQKSKWDLGGQWVSDSQIYISKLLKDLNIETYNQYVNGRKVLETNGKIVTYNSSMPNVSILSLLDLQMGSMKISSNAKKISTIFPFENIELASRLDKGSFDEFLLSTSFSSKSRSLLNPTVRTIFGVEPSQINGLFGLMYIKSGGGSLESLALTDKGCAQEKRVKGGTQQISEKLSQIITQNENNKILLNTELKEIVQSSNLESSIEVLVKNLNGKLEKFSCKKVISSIPINQYVHIKFEPELPSYKRNVFQYCQMGNLIKFVVTYKKPFWRLNGFSGEVVSDGSVIWLDSSNLVDYGENSEIPKVGPVACVFDGCNDDNKAALVGFIGAKMAVEWSDQQKDIRKQEVIEALVRYFGEESRNYIDYGEKLWSREKFSGGCPTCILSSSGVMQDYARAVREPFLNVHFCGTESATVWQGYMDGAIQSGERAANEVLYAMFKDDRSVEYDYENTYYFHKEITRSKNGKK